MVLLNIRIFLIFFAMYAYIAVAQAIEILSNVISFYRQHAILLKNHNKKELELKLIFFETEKKQLMQKKGRLFEEYDILLTTFIDD